MVNLRAILVGLAALAALLLAVPAAAGEPGEPSGGGRAPSASPTPTPTPPSPEVTVGPITLPPPPRANAEPPTGIAEPAFPGTPGWTGPREMPSTEAIIGTDDRVRVTGTTSVPWRWIAYLDVQFANGSGQCTGFFIGPRTVATAGHCVYDGDPAAGGWAQSVVVTPGKNGTSAPYGSQTTSNFWTTVAWVQSADPAGDFAAIILPDSTLGDQVGWFNFASFSDADLAAAGVNLAGYPGDHPGELWHGDGPISGVSSTHLSYPIDTFGGQSGSPVWISDGTNRYVVAVHTLAASSSRCASGSNCGVRVTSGVASFFARAQAAQPRVTSVASSATSITLGRAVDITVDATNEGLVAADWQSINVSFPANPSSVQILPATTVPGAQTYAAGASVGCNYGGTLGPNPCTLQHVMAEGFMAPWPGLSSSTTMTLAVRVTPQQAGTFTYYVKSVARTASLWTADPLTGPKDQQGEFVTAYTVTVNPGGAVRPGFDSTVFPGNDDGTYPCASSERGTPTGCTPTPVSIGFSPNFLGAAYSQLYVNNNGNVTFNSPLDAYTPFGLTASTVPIIAPFFADVDTRTGNVATFGHGTVDGHNAFAVNWPGVGCYSQITSVTNDFQLVLIDRSDTGTGDFDIEFNYGQIQWEAGTASGGDSNCLGGQSTARVGFSNGQGNASELAGSGVAGALLDSNSAGLIHRSLNSSLLGRYVFPVRNGGVGVLPSITALSPNNLGIGAGSQTVTITGANFQSGAAVASTNTGVATVSNIQFVDSSHISVLVTPVATGATQFTVTNPDGNVATSPQFVVFGPPAKLAFITQPGGNTAPAPTAPKTAYTKPSPGATAAPALTAPETAFVQQPVVAVEDANGNVVPTASNAVTLAITPNTGTAEAVLTCEANTVAAVNGVASFAGCQIDKAGTGYTLTASAAGLTSATSAAFNIVTDSCPTGQYLAEYYNNMLLSGAPTFTRCEQAPIDYWWWDGGPGNGVGNDNFSARWSGSFSLSAGTYNFVAMTDDGMRVWVDGSLIIDAWRQQGPTEYRATRTLSGGAHQIKVEYYEQGGAAVAQFRWEVVTPSPAVTGISPDSRGVNDGPVTVTITGTGFQAGVTVTSTNTGVCTVSNANRVSATTITMTVTPVADGQCQFRVTNPDGGNATSGPFTVGTAVQLQLLPNPAMAALNGAPASLDIIIEAGAQPLDAVEVQLSFDKNKLRVTDANGNPITSITPGPVFQTVLLNGVNTTGVQGLIIFAAGRATGQTPPSGHILLATVKFQGLVAGDQPVNFVAAGVQATFGGVLLPVSLTDGVVRVVPRSLVFTTQPIGGATGFAFGMQPVVELKDGTGATVTSDNSTVVTLEIGTPGGAVLSGCAVNGAPGLSGALVAGKATFSGCKLDLSAAGYVLRATATGASTGQTAPFNITFAGDASGDCRVSVVDYSLVVTYFGLAVTYSGAVPSDPRWTDPATLAHRADLSGDLRVSVLDYSIVVTQFGQNTASCAPPSTGNPHPGT